MKCLAGNAFRVILVSLAISLLSVIATAQVAVRHQEGTQRGFLVLRSPEGEVLASGDSWQVARGSRVTSHLAFHFKDGSTYEETTDFSQRHNFRLLSYHLVQKGPSFPHPQDLAIDAAKGNVTVRSTGDDGKEQVKTDHMKLPPDLANGMVTTLAKNLPSEGAETRVSMLAATPKLRLVKLAISAQGEDSFSIAGSKHKAVHFLVKIELGGLTGVVAPLIGKQPPDVHVWIADGEAPAFVRLQGPLYAEGPVWTIELANPVWPKEGEAEKK